MSTNRIPWFDNIKGFMILLVVFGHLIETFRDLEGNETVLYLYNVIYFFHMPLFIMISGYFYRPNRYERIIQFFFIFLIWHFINGIVVNLMENNEPIIIDPESRVFEVFDPYWTMWFLLGIILWNIITPYVLKLRYPLLYAIGFAALISYAEEVTGWFSLRKLVNFYPYFLIGYFLAQKNILISLKKKSHNSQIPIKIGSLIIIFSFLIAMLYFLKFPLGTEFLFLRESYQYFNWTFLEGFTYQVLLYFLATILSVAIILLIPKDRKIYFINLFGYFSLYIYLAHTTIVRLFREYVPESIYQNDWLLLICSLILSILICWLLTNKLIRLLLKPLIEPDLSFLFKKGEK